VTRAVRVPLSTTGLMVCTRPVNDSPGKAAKLTLAVRPGARCEISLSSTCTSTRIGSSDTMVISSSPCRTHWPGTTLSDATRPAKGVAVRMRVRSSWARRSFTSAAGTPLRMRAAASRSSRTDASSMRSSSRVASRSLFCASATAARASSTASAYSAPSSPTTVCPLRTASPSRTPSETMRPFTCATSTVFCHASACPAALTDITRSPRTAGVPCTGMATSVAKVPDAEVCTSGAVVSLAVSPEAASALWMRP
jgi:hypothetical protein